MIKVDPNNENNQSLAGLRSIALVAVVIGAIGSIGLLRHAPQRPPALLAVLFVIWVFAPFAILGVANMFSSRWPRPVRVTFYVVTLVVTAASLAIYLDNNIVHRPAHPAEVWVAVPPASVFLSVITVAVAAATNRRKGERHADS